MTKHLVIVDDEFMGEHDWLMLAQGHDETRPSLELIHGGAMADGYRIHAISPDQRKPCECDAPESVHEGIKNILANTKNDPIAFRINRRYLLEVLIGMGGGDDEAVITFRSEKPTAPVFITDGNREAVIMPLHLEKV